MGLSNGLQFNLVWYAFWLTVWLYLAGLLGIVIWLGFGMIWGAWWFLFSRIQKWERKMRHELEPNEIREMDAVNPETLVDTTAEEVGTGVPSRSRSYKEFSNENAVGPSTWKPAEPSWHEQNLAAFRQLLEKRAVLAGLFWSLPETSVLIMFTLGGGFGSVYPTLYWISLLVILGVAFLIGYALSDLSSSLKSFFVAHAVSLSFYASVFLLIPAALSPSIFPSTETSSGFSAEALTIILGLGVPIFFYGALSSVLGSTLSERYSRPPVRPL